MKKTSKILASVVILFVIAGLTLPLLKIYAAEPAGQNLQTPLEQVQNKVDELVELKDNSTLSDQEKESQEMHIRKEALDQIIDLSLSETKNLENKLNTLTLTSDDQKAAKDKFIEILDKNIAYSGDLKLNVDKNSITLDEIKNLAQEYKDWRADNYDVYIKKITAFVLIFQEQNVLKIANTRLDKIMSDLNNLENAKLITKKDTWNLVNLSMKSLGNAKIYNSEAEKIISGYVQGLLAMTSSTQETASSTTLEIATATSSEDSIQIVASAQPNIEATSTITAAATSSEAQINIENKSHDLIEQSLKEIKNAYNDFMAISNLVSQKLKIK